MAKTAKVTFIIIFLPTILHDLAASRQVKKKMRVPIYSYNFEIMKGPVLQICCIEVVS